MLGDALLLRWRAILAMVLPLSLRTLHIRPHKDVAHQAPLRARQAIRPTAAADGCVASRKPTLFTQGKAEYLWVPEPFVCFSSHNEMRPYNGAALSPLLVNAAVSVCAMKRWLCQGSKQTKETMFGWQWWFLCHSLSSAGLFFASLFPLCFIVSFAVE